MSAWLWRLVDISRRMWFGIGLPGVAAAGFATLVDRSVPADWTFSIGSDSINTLPGIIASSMLAVTTFSPGTRTTPPGGGAATMTSRTRRQRSGNGSRRTRCRPLSAFLFSVVGIVVLRATC